jgi:hypothetical protein
MDYQHPDPEEAGQNPNDTQQAEQNKLMTQTTTHGRTTDSSTTPAIKISTTNASSTEITTTIRIGAANASAKKCSAYCGDEKPSKKLRDLLQEQHYRPRM